MMTASDVIRIADILESSNIRYWIDGGWGIDVLLSRQTREHDDLDLVIEISQAESAKAALSTVGFSLLENEFPTRFVLADRSGRRIDFHPVRFDHEGGGIQQLQQKDSFYRYPPQGFKASGQLAARVLPCVSGDVQMECHLGYEPDEKDLHDVRLLHEALGIRLRGKYRELLKDRSHS
jgi:lincosamide nucleotidyltransferase A/C/D/E